MNIESWTWLFPTVMSWAEWFAMSVGGLAAIFTLVILWRAKIRERREAEIEDRRMRRLEEIARAPFPAGRIPPPSSYTRAEWLRDMEDPELTIEEITRRVIVSNGSWRTRPAPIAPGPVHYKSGPMQKAGEETIAWRGLSISKQLGLIALFAILPAVAYAIEDIFDRK